jgi:type II secretory pathway component GspD/PulD (secretin)
MKFKTLLVVGYLLLSFSLTAYTQTTNTQQKQQPEETSATQSNKAMIAKIFTVRHRKPRDLAASVTLLGSGEKNSNLSFSPELNTISVRDYPENVAAIEIALKRLDLPVERESEPDIEFELHVLLATNAEIPTTVLPNAIRDVIKIISCWLRIFSGRR